MAVFRVERNTGYTVMSNHHLRNKKLTLKAKGLLSQMLSLPEDWDYTLAGLSHINRESIDAISRKRGLCPLSPLGRTLSPFSGGLRLPVSTLSIGMMIGGIAKNSKSASVIACVLYFPMLIFSGATLPFEVMPDIMQNVISIFPMTQGIQLMKTAFLGLPADNIVTPIIVMVIVTVLCTSVAIKYFKWE